MINYLQRHSSSASINIFSDCHWSDVIDQWLTNQNTMQPGILVALCFWTNCNAIEALIEVLLNGKELNWIDYMVI